MGNLKKSHFTILFTKKQNLNRFLCWKQYKFPLSASLRSGWPAFCLPLYPHNSYSIDIHGLFWLRKIKVRTL